MSQTKYVKMVGRCPRCGESVDIVLSKKDVKMMLKRMKMPTHQANLEVEKELREKGVW